MKKLAIVLLLVTACSRQVVVGSPEADRGPGAPSARAAVDKFMASARAQNLEAMADIWGTQEGPARETLSRERWEQSEVVMMRCLRHDSYTVISEAPAAGGERVFAVELKFGDLTRTSTFTATPGPSSRWYLRIFDINALQDICVAR